MNDLHQLVLACVAAGAYVRRVGGDQFSLAGGEVSDEVFGAIKANREGFLAAWNEYEHGRYGKPPPECLPLSRKPPVWSSVVMGKVRGYIDRQGDDVTRWCLLRADAYRVAYPGLSTRDLANSAMRDVMHWQLARHKHPETFLAHLDEAYQDLKKL